MRLKIGMKKTKVGLIGLGAMGAGMAGVVAPITCFSRVSPLPAAQAK
jgi:predicted homoserine dehydrogenase-like protein